MTQASNLSSIRYCPKCGYDLRGHAGKIIRCPECGSSNRRIDLLRSPPEKTINNAQWTVASFLFGLMVFAAGYQMLSIGQLKQTAMLFIGLPGVLAISLTLMPRAQSASMIAVKGTAIALLASGMFLGEGFICCVIMSPIFFLVAGAIGGLIDLCYSMKRNAMRVSRLVILLALLAFSLEGVADGLTFSRSGSATASRIVEATSQQVRDALAVTPEFDAELPLFFRIGFPRPVDTSGQGLKIGDQRVISFQHGDRLGDLEMLVTHVGPTDVVFSPISDDSKIAGWLGWERSHVSWSAIDADTTQVDWTLEYERRLDPAWYFGPIENYAVSLAAGYLIDTLATPDSAVRVAGSGWIRGASLFGPLLVILIAWYFIRPGRRVVVGAWLATGWSFISLLALNKLAIHESWWNFQAQGGVFLDAPLDLILGWAILWGAVPALLFRRVPMLILAVLMFWLDLIVMPACSPLINLEPYWYRGELLGLVCVLFPAQLLARWTVNDRYTGWRAAMQVFGLFAGILWLAPELVSVWTQNNVLADAGADVPMWLTKAQLILAAALPGIYAVQAFVDRGGGTPLPYDPPRRLVTSGIYRYIANPMQLSALLVMLAWGLLLSNIWVAASGLMIWVYGHGFARWHESLQMRKRYRQQWVRHRRYVREWIPRWRPYHDESAGPARLYVAYGCGPCSAVGRWYLKRKPVGLAVLPAESHPSQKLTRITYESPGGSYVVNGVKAIACGLEHLNLAWALVGGFLQLPGVSYVAQVLCDAAGGGPRVIGDAESVQGCRLE